jgi:hypothetical protein
MAYYFDTQYYIDCKVTQLRVTGATDKFGNTYTSDSLLTLLGELGISPQQHYELFGYKENLNPNHYFNQAEYLDAKLRQLKLTEPDQNWDMGKLTKALADSGLTAVEHYERFGAFEDDGRGLGFYLNPSNAFDANAYYSAKLLMLRQSDPSYSLERLVGEMRTAELSPIMHYTAYGKSESDASGIDLVQTVPHGQRVLADPNRITLGEVVPDNTYPDTPAPGSVARSVPHPEDIGHYTPPPPSSTTPTTPTVPEGPYEDPSDPGPFQVSLVGGRLSFSGTLGMGIEAEVAGLGREQTVAFTSHGASAKGVKVADIKAVHLALGQDLVLDDFAEITAFFANKHLQFEGNGSLALDITQVATQELEDFGHRGVQDNNNMLCLSAVDNFAGARLLISDHYEIGVPGRQFVEGIRREGADEKYKVFWTGHVEDYGDISHIPHVEVARNATLIASKAQVSRLDGKIITGEGNVTIKADMGGEAKPNQEFTVQTLGQNVIAAGLGADKIVLGEGTGRDILIFKYNDSQLGSTANPGWDRVSNFDVANDKLVFIYKWNGTNVSPAANDVINPNIHLGQGELAKGIRFENGIVHYDAPPARNVHDKVRDVLNALDTHIQLNGGYISVEDLLQPKQPVAPNSLTAVPTANDGRFWANDIWAYETGGSTFILKADGFEGRKAQFAGDMLASPGDTVIELVGVTGLQGADLVNMLQVNALIDWGG